MMRSIAISLAWMSEPTAALMTNTTMAGAAVVEGVGEHRIVTCKRAMINCKKLR
jgi:hypothetical protein